MPLREHLLGAIAGLALAAGMTLPLVTRSQTAGQAAAAGPPATNAAAPRSVWDGVYSKEQVSRGKKGYDIECARCHGENLLGGENSPALVETVFLKKWNGKSVGDLIDLTRKKMPSDGPGKLSRQLCTDITVYVLSANGYPAGETDLKSDAALLSQILIQLKK